MIQDDKVFGAALLVTTAWFCILSISADPGAEHKWRSRIWFVSDSLFDELFRKRLAA